MRHLTPLFPLLCSIGFLLIAGSCSDGGTQQNADSEIKLEDVNHHMHGISGRQVVAAFPVSANDYLAEAAVLLLKSNARWTIASVGKATTPERPYDLKSNNEFTLLLPRQGLSSLSFPGYLDIEGDSYFFLDRSLESKNLTENSIGFWAGVAETSGLPKIKGKWSVFGSTVIFADEKDKPSRDLVGRAFAGTIEFDEDGKILAGLWKDSSGSSVTVTGSGKSFKNGAVDLSLQLAGGPATGARTYSGGIGKSIGVFSDFVATDGQIGMLFLVRESSNDLVLKDIAGIYDFGGHTIFNNPAAIATDVAIGTVEITETGTWKLSGRSALNQIFSHSGSVEIDKNGRLFLEEDRGSKQIWLAAVSTDGRNIIIADTTNESSLPNVGFFMGIKRGSN